MLADQILHRLKLNGQMLDTEIAAALGVSVKQVRSVLADMADRGAVMGCSVTRYADGKPVQALLYRISGYVPPSAPGRKPGQAVAR